MESQSKSVAVRVASSLENCRRNTSRNHRKILSDEAFGMGNRIPVLPNLNSHGDDRALATGTPPLNSIDAQGPYASDILASAMDLLDVNLRIANAIGRALG
jgi:hypothetical protein